MDVLTLARIQFGATIAFHYLYPPLSIGLGVLLVIMEGLWLKTKNPVYHQMARFWTRVFALTFAIGGISYCMPRYLTEVRGLPATAKVTFGAILCAAGFIATIVHDLMVFQLRTYLAATLQIELAEQMHA